MADAPATTPENARRRKGAAFAIICGTAVFGIIGASAATLGGITGNSLGAEVAVVASCDTDGVAVAYTTGYNATSGAYDATAVNVTGINSACNGNTIELTVKNGAGTALGSGSSTVAGGAATVTLSAPADAANVQGIAVVING